MRRESRAHKNTHTLWSYLKDYRFKGILIKYFLLLLLCLVLPTSLLNGLYGQQIQSNTQKEILRINDFSLKRSRSTIDSLLYAVKSLAFGLAGQERLRYLSTLGNELGQDSRGELTGLRETLSSLQQAYEYIDSIYIYLEAADAVISSKGITDRPVLADKAWFNQYSSAMEPRTIMRIRCKNNRYPYLISVMHPIYSAARRCLGMVVVNVNVEYLGESIGTGKYRSAGDDSRLLIFDEEMKTLVYSDEFRLLLDEPGELEELRAFSGRNEDFSECVTLWGDSYVLSGCYSELDGLRYLYLTPLSRFDLENQRANALLVQIMLLSVALCLVLAVLLSVWVYRPIQKTRQLIDRTSQWTAWDKKERLDEIQEIQRAILHTQSENQILNEEIKERMNSLHSAQICALQSQINPHFLFNTLDAIRNAAVLQNGRDNIVGDMLLTLGQLMRLSLAGQNYLVPVSEELEHVRLYGKIMDFRYKGKVRIHLQISENVMEEKIVKLTLQPLIENAIEHGLRQKHCQGDIWIRSGRNGDMVYIDVVDNGVGLDEKELETLRESIQRESYTDHRQIGLRNVNQRLKLIFGEPYGLRLDHSTEGGMWIRICFRSLPKLLETIQEEKKR